jgi:hypothetical protein
MAENEHDHGSERAAGLHRRDTCSTSTERGQPVSAAPKAKCCPACSGTSGYEYDMVVAHVMNAPWGEDGECGDSQHHSQSLVKCLDCGAKFQFSALKKKGLAS